MISIIVHADEVSILIKGYFLWISQAMRKHFEVASIRIDSHHRSLMRIGPFLAICVFRINPYVSY